MKKGKYKIFSPNKKRGLAALNPDPVKKLRQTQAICYLSLLANVVFIVCIAVIMMLGR